MATVQHRAVGETAGRERRGESDGHLGPAWRAATAVAGGLLLANGLRRRSIGGLAAALAGGMLLRQGVRGDGNLLKTLRLREPDGEREPIVLQRTVTILRPAMELYNLWCDPVATKLIMADIADVTVAGDRSAHWVVRGPLGLELAWDTRVVEDRPGELLRWRSVRGAAVPHEGTILFRPSQREIATEVVLQLRFAPPGGTLGREAVGLLQAFPKGLERKLLRNFQCLAEVGEVTVTRGQPACRSGGRDD